MLRLINPMLFLKKRNNASKPKPVVQPVLNLYEPTTPQTLNSKKPPHLYDINFVWPFEIVETDAVRLEPLIPSKHLDGFLALPEKSWDVFGEVGPFDRDSALETIEDYRTDPSRLMLAVIDKHAMDEGGGFAGVYSLIECDEEMAPLFGVININPRYHRTHINTHAMFLTLRYLFETAQVVRVQYDAVTFNQNSIRAALRFGFREEGVARNLNGLVPVHKRREGEEEKGSQDLWCSSMTDYEWFKGGKALMTSLMDRPIVTSA